MLKIQKPSNKVILGGLALLIIIGAGAGYYIKTKNDKVADKPQTTAQGEQINLDPPTKEDAQRVADNKQQIVDRDDALKAQPRSGSSQKSVKPVITYAGQYDGNVEVGGFVSGIFEDGGTCTATFTLGSAKVTKSVTAIKNANSVDCPAIVIGSNEFKQKGQWNLVLSYSSASYSGSSETKQIEVK